MQFGFLQKKNLHKTTSGKPSEVHAGALSEHVLGVTPGFNSKVPTKALPKYFSCSSCRNSFCLSRSFAWDSPEFLPEIHPNVFLEFRQEFFSFLITFLLEFHLGFKQDFF